MSDGFVDRLFEAHAAPKERRRRRALKHTIDDAMESVIERSVAHKRWLSWRSRRRAMLMAQHPKLEPLVRLFSKLQPGDGPAAVKAVENAMPHIVQLDRTGRSELLLIISEGISEARVKAGLNPFEDPLPELNQPPSAYDLIRAEFDKLPVPRTHHDDP